MYDDYLKYRNFRNLINSTTKIQNKMSERCECISGK